MSSAISMPVLARRGDQAAEVVERAELRQDRGVAAFVGADRPRAADVVGLGDERVVAALALDPADRVDRREVQDVEAEPGDVRQARLDVLEGAVPPRRRAEAERGNSSYQALNRARSRSATSGSSVPYMVCRLRSG